MKRKKLPTLSSLEARLDKAFSRYIRQRDADEGGTVRCVTCGKLMFWMDSHAGHFIKRQHRSVRWDERNVHVQCPAENTFKGGSQDEYAKFIIEKYGIEVFDELMELKHQTVKHTRDDLLQMLEKFKQ